MTTDRASSILEVDDFYERILFMGGYKVGKSYAILKTFSYFAKHRPDVSLFVIDTDKSIRRTIVLEFPELRNVVHVYPAREYRDILDAAKAIAGQAKKGDWAAVDMINMPWEASQRYEISRVFNSDVGMYMLEKRMQMPHDSKSLYAGQGLLKGWLDWPVVNNMYRDIIYPLFAAPVHLIAATGLREFAKEEGDNPPDADIRSAYAPFGFRADGQKHLGHQFQTIVWLHRAAKSETWYMTIVGDRGRKTEMSVPLKDFSLDYLEKRAG